MMRLESVIRDKLIKLKAYLRKGNYFEQEKEIDYILCQYDSKCIMDKKVLLEQLLFCCHGSAYGELLVPSITPSKWLLFLTEIRDDISLHLETLENQIRCLPFRYIEYDNYIYDVFTDVCQWAQFDSVIVLLLKKNNEYFQDNIAAFDYKGNSIWSTQEVIEVKNRQGAVFTYLVQLDEDLISIQAWVGVNYTVDARTGRVVKSAVTK